MRDRRRRMVNFSDGGDDANGAPAESFDAQHQLRIGKLPDLPSETLDAIQGLLVLLIIRRKDIQIGLILIFRFQKPGPSSFEPPAHEEDHQQGEKRGKEEESADPVLLKELDEGVPSQGGYS